MKKYTGNEKFLTFSIRFNKNITFFGIFTYFWPVRAPNGAELSQARVSKIFAYGAVAERVPVFGKQRRDMEVHFCEQKFRIWGYRTELGPRRWIAGRRQDDILFNPGRIIYYILFYINK